MHIYKRGQHWWIQGFDAYGKRIRKTTHTTDKAEAKRVLDALRLATVAKDFRTAVEFLRLYFRDGGTPISETWRKYIEIAHSTGRDTVAEDTMRKRRERVYRFLTWLETDRPKVRTVEAIDGPCAAAYASYLSAIGRTAKTRVNIISDLSTVWRSLEKVSPDIRNPWSDLTPRVTDSERFKAFTDEEEKRVFDAAKKIGKGWYLACLVAADTGLRYGDVAALRWDEIEFAARLIRLTPRKTKKHNIAVALPLSPRLFDALSESEKLATKGEVFVLPQHAVLNGKRGGIRRDLNFREVLDAAGISGKGYCFHSFRHTFRTRLAAAGVSTEVAMRLCGHTDRNTSARYDHDEHLQELRSAVDAVSRK